jgi:hypothetical protein
LLGSLRDAGTSFGAIDRGFGRREQRSGACTPPGSGGGAWLEAWNAEHREEFEAERQRKHAEGMAQWRAEMRQREATMPANRRRAEQKRPKVA